MREELALKITEALDNYGEAKFQLEQAKNKLSQIAEGCSDLTVKEAFKAGLIRFNFPVHPGFRKFLCD